MEEALVVRIDALTVSLLKNYGLAAFRVYLFFQLFHQPVQGLHQFTIAA